MWDAVPLACRLLGGVALLLGGIALTGAGMQRLQTGRLAQGGRLRGVLVGTGATAVLQSSSAVTASVCAMADGGLLAPSMAAGLIYGANLGTTATAWLCALGLRPGGVLPVLAAIASLLPRRRAWRQTLLGLAILFTGLGWMEASGTALGAMLAPQLARCRAPALGFLIGVALAAAMQTSSGAIALLQALGQLPGHTALAMTLGCNVGTCVTALLASAEMGRTGRAAARLHLLFNLLAVLPGAALIALWPPDVDAASIALFHTLANAAAIPLALPLSPWLEALARGRRDSTDFSPAAR